MYYKSVILTSLKLESCVLVYVGPSRQVNKIEVGVKELRPGWVGFAPKSTTRLPLSDIEGINWEYNRLVEKAIDQGFGPVWQKPAQVRAWRQLQLNFDNN